MPNLVVTNNCNLKCPYCFASEYTKTEKTEMTLEDLAKIKKFFGQNKLYSVLGGEPFTHSNIINLLKKIGNISTIFTNGLLIHNFIEDLTNYNLGININGPKDIGEKAFNILCNNLELCKKNNINVALGYNDYDGSDPSFLRDLLIDIPYPSIRYSCTAPSINNTICKEEYYLKAKERLFNFLEMIMRYNMEIQFDCNNIPLCYFSKKELEKFPMLKKIVPMCLPSMDVFPNGDIIPCFGNFDLKENIFNFKNEDEIKQYFIYKMKEKSVLKTEEKCKCNNCFQLSSLCQGGCLAFQRKGEKEK